MKEEESKEPKFSLGESGSQQYYPPPRRVERIPGSVISTWPNRPDQSDRPDQSEPELDQLGVLFPEVRYMVTIARAGAEVARLLKLENENARMRQILASLDPFPCDHNIKTQPYYGRSGKRSGGLRWYKKVSSGGPHHSLLQHRAIVRWLIFHDNIHDQPDGSNTCPVRWRKVDEWGNLMTVHHMDGDTTNNNPANLVYMPWCLNNTGVNQHTSKKKQPEGDLGGDQ